jgi:hypothetical protein
MGLWKGRIPWLRRIRKRITNNPESLKRILCYKDATGVLHIMLIEFEDGDMNDKLWNIEEETLSDIGDVTHMPERIAWTCHCHLVCYPAQDVSS